MFGRGIVMTACHELVEWFLDSGVLPAIRWRKKEKEMLTMPVIIDRPDSNRAKDAVRIHLGAENKNARAARKARQRAQKKTSCPMWRALLAAGISQ